MTFDPYHRWLGIHPSEQPPNYYRLLGVREFEDDPDVIEHAMDRQMRHIRGVALGAHMVHAQQILNEISQAGGVLLDPQRRLAYDQNLLAARESRAEKARGSEAVSLVIPNQKGLSSTGAKSARRVREQGSGFKTAIGLVQIVFGGVAGLCITIVILLAVWKKDPLGIVANGNPGSPEPPATKNAPPEPPPSTIDRFQPSPQLEPSATRPSEIGDNPASVDQSASSIATSPSNANAVVEPSDRKRDPVAQPTGAAGNRPDEAPAAVEPKPSPVAESHGSQIPKDRNARERERQDAISRGDLPSVLEAIEHLAALDSKSAIAEKLLFLQMLDSRQFPNERQVLDSFVSLLEQAVKNGEKELAAKYVNEVLARARMLGDRALERRATRVVLDSR